jgi:hypothetical protein
MLNDPKWIARNKDWCIGEEWQGVIYRYVVHGLPPGSFFRALLANDLKMAACHSHPANTWQAIICVCKWLINEAPHNCHGSYDAVDAWIKLPQAERRRICEVKQLISTEQEVMWSIMKKEKHEQT